MSVIMDTLSALAAFDALSQSTRLIAIQLLVKAGPEGVSAGTVAAHLNVPHNTMSGHLKTLEQAGLAASERQGRQIIYRARYDTLRGLLSFMMVDCCQGLPEIIGALPEPQHDCCSPTLEEGTSP